MMRKWDFLRTAMFLPIQSATIELVVLPKFSNLSWLRAKMEQIQGPPRQKIRLLSKAFLLCGDRFLASRNRSAKSRAGSKKKTGFAAMSKEKRTEVARKGGRAAARARSKKR
jgi:hypothetical protein